jgi:lipoprotein-releasing system permease protein
VAAVARTGFAPGLLLSASDPRGADMLVKGLDVPEGLSTTRLFGRVPGAAHLLSTEGPRGEIPTILGVGLARRLGVRTGSRVVLETSSPLLASGLAPPRQTLLTVAGIVETGFSEVDDGWAVLPLAAFDRLAPPGAREGVYELKLTRVPESDRVVAAAREVVGRSGTVLDWRTLNRDLFQALLVQQTLLFVVLVLIVAVAAGTVVSSLVVLLAEKTRDVGVLSALGAPPSLIGRVFRLSGLLLGGAGLLTGILFGLSVCFVLTTTRAVRFPPEIAKVYYLSWMPFRPEPLHLVAILFVGLLLVLVASLLPARRATRLSPAEALRYE